MPWANSPEDRSRSAQVYGAEYRRNRTLALRRDKWRCQIRLPGCTGAASQADHIIPVSEGGTHDVSNLRAACKSCHQKTTAQQGRGYRRRPGPPADPQPRPTTQW